MSFYHNTLVLLLTLVPLLVSSTRAQARRCRGRGSCPPGKECFRRSRCETPLYSYPDSPNFKPISAIQGPGTISPFLGKTVTTIGVITAIDNRNALPSIFIQDIYEDANPLTSEALYLFRISFPDGAPSPAVGDVITATGQITEFTPRSRPADLPVTEIAFGAADFVSPGAGIVVDPIPFSANRLRLSSFGTGSGYEQDPSAPRTNLVDENYTCSRPRESAMCLYEAHEHMLVRLVNPRTLTPELRFGEIGVLPDPSTCVRRCRLDGVVTRRNFGAYVITVEDDLVPRGNRNLGIGQNLQTIPGVVFYSFSQYKIYNTEPLRLSDSFFPRGLQPCPSFETRPGTLRISSWNLLNRDPRDPPDELRATADNIATFQRCPDIIGLSEIGDNDGPARSGETSANKTLQGLAAAVSTSCDITYLFTDIAPLDLQDGGLPGENIRVAILYREDKVELVPGASKGSSTAAVAYDIVTESLTLNPGRIDSSSFPDSRKPLAAEFQFSKTQNNFSFILVVNHWNSKRGDDSLFGRVQPPLQHSQSERNVHSDAVKSFIASIPRKKPVFAIGDFNDFHFSGPVQNLGLRNLWRTVPTSDRYSFTFQSRRQTLDHILVRRRGMSCDRLCAVHSSTRSPEGSVLRPTDHDALVAVCSLTKAID